MSCSWPGWPLGWRPDRALSLVIVGMVVNTVGDAVYLLQSAADTYQADSPANLLWIAAFVLTALAPWADSGQAGTSPAKRHSGLLLPTASAVAALAMLVVATRIPVLGIAVALAAAALSAAGVRVGLAFAELRSLARSRIEARTDELTGLPNRRAFIELVERELSVVAEEGSFSLLLRAAAPGWRCGPLVPSGRQLVVGVERGDVQHLPDLGRDRRVG